jgi:hypothetical protein
MSSNLETPYVGAYWSARRATLRECALRIAEFLAAIADQPLFARWHLKARSRKAASVPLDISVEAIEAHLKTNNRDTDGTAIHELGFSLSVWNGIDDSPASFAVTCGAFSNYVKNSAVLSLPSKPVPIDGATQGLLRMLLEQSVQVWDPDSAAATSSESIARAGGGMPWEAGGWFVYRRGKGIAPSSAK